MENFAKEFMTHLNGKVSDDELAVILRELEVFSGTYDIQKKETALAEYTPQIPECYKVYMISKKIEGLSEETLKTVHCVKLENNIKIEKFIPKSIRIGCFLLWIFPERRNRS